MPSPSTQSATKNKPATKNKSAIKNKSATKNKSTAAANSAANNSAATPAETSKGSAKQSRTAKETQVVKAARVVVKKSPLGKALFSKSGFAAEEQIGLVTGKLIQDAEYGSEYCIAVSDHASLEPAAPFRYLNHSCEPNCQLMTWEDEESKVQQLGVFALTEIKPGVELTIDYAWSADAAIRCLCGKSNCRGWVVAESELAVVKRRNRKKKNSAAPQSTSI